MNIAFTGAHPGVVFSEIQDINSHLKLPLPDSGVLVYVPKGIKVKDVLKNTYLIKEEGKYFNHVIIYLEEGSSLAYMEEHLSEQGEFIAEREYEVKIFAMPGSRLKFISSHAWKQNVVGKASIKAKQQEGSYIEYIFACTGGKKAETVLETNLAGSQVKVLGAVYGNNQEFDFTANVVHMSKSRADILINSALKGRSKSNFNGKITVMETAKGSESWMASNVLLLSNEASATSIPSMDIRTGDVEAGHSATFGELDEEEMFYIKSRGMEAEKLLIKGHLSQITRRAPELKNIEV